ncbi:hypothetical protein [Mesorhizobium sp.]|uniref:hypothetical protein n=1 Tax=Mesorhizobium sp. TaxID=1871066 RepID=UPI0025FAC499|nr:hypothetical protein [Mesorhizobium sp.]
MREHAEIGEAIRKRDLAGPGLMAETTETPLRRMTCKRRECDQAGYRWSTHEEDSR